MSRKAKESKARAIESATAASSASLPPLPHRLRHRHRLSSRCRDSCLPQPPSPQHCHRLRHHHRLSSHFRGCRLLPPPSPPHRSRHSMAAAPLRPPPTPTSTSPTPQPTASVFLNTLPPPPPHGRRTSPLAADTHVRLPRPTAHRPPCFSTRCHRRHCTAAAPPSPPSTPASASLTHQPSALHASQ